MMALLRKDIRVARWYLLAAVAVFLLFSAQLVRYETAFLWVGIALSSALTLLVPFLEWQLNGDRLLASLPVGRADIVRSRYVVAALAVAFSLVVWCAWGRLLLPLLEPGRSTTALWSTIEGQVTFALTAGLVLAVLLPLHFTLGLGRAVLVFSAVSVGVALAYLLATGAPASAADLIGSAAASLRARWGPVPTLVTGVAAFGAMFLGSAWLATRAYERREL